MFPISTQDIALIGFLIFLEGILSIDNALVLAMMARHLPQAQQRRALTYGLFGAVFFRLAALALARQLMAMTWVKFVGGGYLIYIALKHLITGESHDEPSDKAVRKLGFWRTVALIELMDIAFAVDSILAAVALTDKFWIVFTGGFIGVIMMRVAASFFLRLLQKFPRFESTAYQLVLVIGVKVLLEGFHLPMLDFHSASSRAFWIFWLTMLACLLGGFRKK
jgi:YkoY family integral membrane protein